MESRVQPGGSSMSTMERNRARVVRKDSAKHYSTKSLKIGKPKSKLAKYWRNKLAKSFRLHNKPFTTSKDIASRIKWLTKNKPKDDSFQRKKTPTLTKHMYGKAGVTRRNVTAKKPTKFFTLPGQTPESPTYGGTD